MLQFQPFQSAVDVSFWQELAHRKLHAYKLDDSPKAIVGLYRPSVRTTVPAKLCLRRESFSCDTAFPRDVVVPGVLLNKNTIEDFKTCDKQALLNDAGQRVYDSIVTGAATRNPTLLSPFLLLSFADLKQQKFLHWFAHPVLVPPTAFSLIGSPIPLQDVLSPAVLSSMLTSPFLASATSMPAYFAYHTPSGLVVPLSEVFGDGAALNATDCWFGFVDPCPLGTHPGWPLRNFLIYLHEVSKLPVVRILALRSIHVDAPGSDVKSLVFDVALSSTPIVSEGKPVAGRYSVVGWSSNAKGATAPDIVSLKAIMDPTAIAENAVNLNVNLMRWRVLPDLNVDMLSSTKFLLIGAGTLGCNVARSLLGWGVRHITFVDNGKVSFSNPVRQSLFELADCVDGGQYKAVAAAKALQRIFPGVVSEGHVLTIPMPGHPISSPEEEVAVINDVNLLTDLIAAHDVVFILTDTRESRWLPTLLCRQKKTLVVNVALGFDSYLILRHQAPQRGEPGYGCYFCNDIVAPGNTTKDRTLDQQCTVTRPGVAMIASAMAVELTVGLLHHPLKGNAPADDGSASTSGSMFGALPHQLRGFLASFSHILASGVAFSHCPACSEAIATQFAEKGLGFLLEAFNDSKFLERAAGLDKYHSQAEEAYVAWDDDDAEVVEDEL